MPAERKLRIVGDEDATPTAILKQAVPDLAAAEAVVRRLRDIIARSGRLLAAERGVAFIREEKLRQEFAQPEEKQHGDRA